MDTPLNIWDMRRAKKMIEEHHKTYQRMGRVMSGATMLVDGERKVFDRSQGTHMRCGERVPNYYYFTNGTRTTPMRCKVARQNGGIVFVSITRQ